MTKYVFLMAHFITEVLLLKRFFFAFQIPVFPLHVTDYFSPSGLL